MNYFSRSFRGGATPLPVEPQPLPVEPPVGVASVLPLVAFAREQGLSAYDAGYVHLAWKRGATLASFDKAMRAAAERLGIQLIMI